MARADDERALTLAFTRHRRPGRWMDAPEYLLRSLPGHAQAAGLVDDLLCDDAYLLRADLRRLIQAADGAGSAPGRRRAQLLRLTPRAIAASPADRAALFSVTEALDDLGTSYRDGGWQAPYRALWASVKPRSERAALEGHQGWVSGVCPVTVAGKQLLASAGTDGTVRIWDPQTGEQRTMMEGHHGRGQRPVPGHRGRAGAAGQRRRRRDGPDLGPRDRQAAHHDGRRRGRPLVSLPGHRGREAAAGQRQRGRHGADLGPPHRPAAHHPGRPPGRRLVRVPGHRRRGGAAGQRRRRRHRADLGPPDRPAAHHPGRPPA